AEVAARKLSLGNKQRLGLAAALQHHPKLIILDEPTSALDPAGVTMLREGLMHRIDDGVGVLVSSHHLDEVARIANRISVINYVRYIGSLEPDAPDLERAFFGLVLADDEQRFSCAHLVLQLGSNSVKHASLIRSRQSRCWWFWELRFLRAVY